MWEGVEVHVCGGRVWRGACVCVGEDVERSMCVWGGGCGEVEWNLCCGSSKPSFHEKAAATQYKFIVSRSCLPTIKYYGCSSWNATSHSAHTI